MRRTMTTMKPAAPTWGSRLILYGALALILTSGFAAYMQIDTSRALLDGIIKTNRKLGIPVFQYLFTMFNESELVRHLLAELMFLVALFIIAFIFIGQRKRTAACVIMLLLCPLLFWIGCMLGLYSTDLSDLYQLIYAAPLILIAVGCILQIIHRMSLGREARPNYRPPEIRRPKERFPRPVKRTAPERPRRFRDAPGATRMVPNADAPVIQEVERQPKPAATKRLEQQVPARSETHIGKPAQMPVQQPRYEWKTIKRTDPKDVIGQ